MQSLEVALSNEQKILFRKRQEENYEVPNDPIYNAWKSLKTEHEKQENERVKKSAMNALNQGVQQVLENSY